MTSDKKFEIINRNKVDLNLRILRGSAKEQLIETLMMDVLRTTLLEGNRGKS